MSEIQQHYTPEQRANMAKRILSDAEFIRKGATYTEAGRLALSETSVGTYHALEAMKEFKKTVEYATIQEHRKTLNHARMAVGALHLGRKGVFMVNNDPRRPIDETEQLREGLQEDARYLSDNNLVIDTSSRNAQQTYDGLSATSEMLSNTIVPLALRPDLRIGSPVQAPNSRNGTVENGWTIIDIDANANFTLFNPEDSGNIAAHVPISQIMELNPVVEAAP